MTLKISKNGDLIIPSTLLEELSLSAADEVSIEVLGNQIIIVSVDSIQHHQEDTEVTPEERMALNREKIDKHGTI